MANTYPVDLTARQMRVWSGQMLQPDEPLYNMVFTFTIEANIQVDLFREAFQRLTDEHDIHRLVISLEQGLPKQHVLSNVESQLKCLDFSSDPSPETKLEHWIDEDKKRLFSPGELLYTTALFKLAEERYVWYANYHHLITDGWSYALLYRDLNQKYQALLNGETAGLAVKNHSAKGYVQSVDVLSQTETSEYWQNKKKTITNPVPFYGRRQKGESGASTRVARYLGKERTERLKALCKKPLIRAWTTDMTLNNVFLTVVNALIYKVSGQSDFSLGVPSHSRFTPDTKKTAGLYMELMPLASSIQPGETFLSLFERTRGEAIEVLKNAAQARPPMEFLRGFNAILNFIPQQFEPFAGNITHTNWIHPDHHDPRHHLRLQIHDFDNIGDFLLQFDLNNEVFSAQKAESVVPHFISLLDAFIDDFHQKLDDLEIISDQEIALINKWNDTAVPIPNGETLLSGFRAQARKTPGNCALIFNELSITYKEFDERSNQVAHYLIKKGLKPGDVVAIQLERSVELIYSLYGLLKAGGVYLPIDINDPHDRTLFLLEDTQARVFFTKVKGVEYKGLTISQEQLIPLISAESVSSIEIPAKPEDAAYVIYTSGSTGRPKGVIGSHQGICNKLRWHNSLFSITEADVLIQKTPITFDVSLWELFWPLQIGASLVIAQPEAHKDSSQLISLIKTHQVTTIHFVPGMLSAFLKDKAAAECSSLRHVFCSGEALSASVVQEFHNKLSARLHNLYGPTEASVEVTHWTCRKEEVNKVIPIGHAAPNTRLYILDSKLNRVPVGTPGSLFIAGVQVAKGYLNQPALTANKFLPDIASYAQEALMYKTGDIARYREDGAIEYLGRQDNQVKLRGFRIELGEIEETVVKHPNVSQVVVVKIKQENQIEYLVAYYTGLFVEENKMRSLLSRYLPEYMIPSFFVFKEKFDISVNGKVDRKELLNHQIHSDVKENGYQIPETRLQEMICSIWQEILQVEKISIYDQFIHLGGDSLKALVITSRIKDMLDLELSVHLVFTYSDIASYAEYIERLMVEIMSQEDA